MTERRPIDWGHLRRLTPVSAFWGFDRGRPLDRYYIENFLERNRADITGRALEVKDSGYTQRYGAGVTRADVLDIDPENREATIVEDLARADAIPANTFDCFVCTQTLHQIFDIRAAISHAHRILKPDGVLLCTLPSVSRIDSHYEGGWVGGSDYWRLTDASVRGLFAEFFPAAALEVEGFGNVMICAAFLYGLSPDELTSEELDFVDPRFPLLFCVRGVKPGPGVAATMSGGADGEQTR